MPIGRLPRWARRGAGTRGQAEGAGRISFRGKQWLEHDNPYAVGMTGLLGYGGAYKAIHDADLLLLLGTDFPFSDFFRAAT
jgi:TPP-dependent trihydroxycyclohexane-1,2-dione (THcHDO) dehydratase